jgi:hypothetical protein
MKNTLLLFLTLLFVTACNQKEKKSDADTNEGIVKEANKGEYYYYKPEREEDKQKVIYFFDSQGNGKDVVIKYKAIADKYNYLLVGSNTFKNGLSSSEINKHVQFLFESTNSKFRINPQAIYFSGFSGGARAAALLGTKIKEVKGVICCGAGLKDLPPDTNTALVFTSGIHDFNYLEIKRTGADISKKNIPGVTIYFEGKHEWAPVSVFEDAVLFMEFNMYRQLTLIPDTIKVNYFLNKANRTLDVYEQQGKIFQQLTIAGNLIETLEGIYDVEEYISYYKFVLSNEHTAKYLNTLNEIESHESESYGFYSEAFVNKDIHWWKNEKNNLEKLADSKKLSSASAARKLEFIKLLGYIYSEKTILKQDYNQADRYLTLYELFDSENPDVFYLKSLKNLYIGNTEVAVSNLKTAFQKGFKNINKLKSNNKFSAILSNEDIQEQIKKTVQ